MVKLRTIEQIPALPLQARTIQNLMEKKQGVFTVPYKKVAHTFDKL